MYTQCMAFYVRRENVWKQRTCIVQDGGSAKKMGDIENLTVLNLYKLRQHFANYLN